MIFSLTLIGLTFGSFFNVVGLRLPLKQSFVHSRSQCPTCEYTLTWRDLVPVFSYLFLRGKCRRCRTKISPIYPIVELTTGVLFAHSYLVFGLHIELFISIIFISMLMIVFVTDITYMLIPDKLLFFFLPIFVILRIIHPLEPWWDSYIGGLAGLFTLALIIILSRGGMGAGDMKLMGVIGIVLGLQDTYLAFFFATLYGTVISGGLLLLKKIDRKQPIPFGPYIILGALTAYFFADSIVKWYVDTLW
ncbi:A24 family peptidase [Pontibacillus sp. HMF3514]|uniref:prepilin peptidase n=1 Tax=Pontibacillus sp. HMF3514 TaxID=2692425 RepID=UPI0013204081|nr:A24 family peptidase [Pontibacillus sp. HMF3514]QHE53142.1 prepilin peptidase [Pontibacillus sp. HMF3514]